MSDNRLYTALLVFASLLLVAAVVFFSKIPHDLSQLRNRKTVSADSTTTERLSLISAAVNEVPAIRSFEYTGGFENPFRPLHPKRVHSAKRSTGGAGKIARSKFLLKGILTKNKPLAILEDGLGETYIRGVGDKALDQVVVKITSNQVTMRDNLGTYVLVVEEN